MRTCPDISTSQKGNFLERLLQRPYPGFECQPIRRRSPWYALTQCDFQPLLGGPIWIKYLSEAYT
jgi:hypothetical protein